MWGLTMKRDKQIARCHEAVEKLELPPAVFKTCPWEPRDLIVTGLQQWLRCCGVALRDGQVIGMPSRAVDEAWHGLILCTARYQTFCTKAYGKFMHHYPAGGGAEEIDRDPMREQLRRTVIAWSLVARPGEHCVLWDIDRRLGLEEPWGLQPTRIAEIQSAIAQVTGHQVSSAI